MSRADFENCTWREFILRFDGYQIRRAHEFENTRIIAYKLLWAHMDHEKNPMPSIHEFWPLITDESEVVNEQQAEQVEYQRLMKIMAEAAKIKLN